MKWEQIIRFRFQIKTEEGMRVGGGGGGLEIGGMVDANLSAIRNPATSEFYLPGSSLKGKLRSLLEKALDKTQNGRPCGCGTAGCQICKIFGAHMKPGAATAPTRIIVRDAPLSESSRKQHQEQAQKGLPNVEEKTENTVNRKSGTAENPRTGERVLPGTTFDGEILLHVYQGDDAKEMIGLVRQGLALIQEGSSIGASGSRGYGKVRFENLNEETLEVAKLTL